jgi:ABC-2 type transport system ATP-binding protein
MIESAGRPEVDVERLAKTYLGGTEAVRGISFQVRAGEVFGLLGPNGAGKSTTIGMLTTAIIPTAGRARLAGFDVAAHPIAARRISAAVCQDPAVDRALTGRRNLQIHARLWGARAAAARIGQVTEAFGLAAILDRPVGSYSGGQRRRLEIARALLSRPRVLFLDEPTVGLDPRIRHELLDLIGGLAAGGDTTVLLTTHYLDEAERLCGRIAIMHKGRIAGLDSPQALRGRLGDQIIEVRADAGPAAALAALRGGGLAGDAAFTIGQTVTVPVRDGSAASALAAVTALGLPGTQISARPPTLDDVYLRLTGDTLAA